MLYSHNTWYRNRGQVTMTCMPFIVPSFEEAADSFTLRGPLLSVPGTAGYPAVSMSFRRLFVNTPLPHRP
jgi:hypothetical protein